MGIRKTRCLVFLTLTLLIVSCATVKNKPNSSDYIPSAVSPFPDSEYYKRIPQMTRTELEAEIDINSKELIKAMAAQKKAHSAYNTLKKQFEEGNLSDAILFSEVLKAEAASKNEHIWTALLERKRDLLLTAYRELLWSEKGYKR